MLLTDEELAAAAPRKTRTIDIEAFVDLADVDPVYFDHPYFLLPAGRGGGLPPRLSAAGRGDGEHGPRRARALRLRTKEYLVAVRVRDGLLSLTTMLFHDEVRPAKEIPGGGKKPTKERLDQAVALIEAMAVDWDPERYQDRYRKRLQKVIREKKKGKRITVPEDEDEPTPVPDLMEALERSLEMAAR